MRDHAGPCDDIQGCSAGYSRERPTTTQVDVSRRHYSECHLTPLNSASENTLPQQCLIRTANSRARSISFLDVSASSTRDSAPVSTQPRERRPAPEADSLWRKMRKKMSLPPMT